MLRTYDEYEPAREARALRQKYEAEVRPLIEKGDYALASVAMGSARMCVAGFELRVMAGTHKGYGVIVAADNLMNALRSGDSERIEFADEWFRGQAAQIELPSGSLEGI